MLFNSYAFIFLYLPVVFAGMFWLGRYSHRLAALWLGFASLSFYAVWDPRFVLLLLASITFNYGAGYWIGLTRVTKPTRMILAAAVAINLALLGYFKYADFAIASVNQLFGSRVPELDLVLPLGISFFTFTQIAFLVDVHRGVAKEYNFIHYLLFVTYFPHLIAGPILHHGQMMPQFGNRNIYRINSDNVALGITFFILGLTKKVMIADTLAEAATPIFEAARDGKLVMFFEAWIGTLSYTLQLYFDFSGYSDMAIGLSLLFNVRLPLNFESPYKATNIIEFWRRWHMTLSAFLRDYLYFPLGGNRKGPARRYLNLMITMLLGGLWHGAGWTYIAWGGLHGLYLLINHGWRDIKARLGWGPGGAYARLAAGALTFAAVVVAWVFFRADSFTSAWNLLSGMFGTNGVSLPASLEPRLAALFGVLAPDYPVLFKSLTPASRVDSYPALFAVIFGLAIVWLCPNVRQILEPHHPLWDSPSAASVPAKSHRPSRLRWKPTPLMAMMAGFLLLISLLNMASNKPSEFLYFQF